MPCFAGIEHKMAMKSLLSHLDFKENKCIHTKVLLKDITYKFNMFFEKEQISH